jgi:hypothetical protein
MLIYAIASELSSLKPLEEPAKLTPCPPIAHLALDSHF